MHKNTMKTPSRQFKCSFRHKQNCEITNGISMLNTHSPTQLVSNVSNRKIILICGKKDKRCPHLNVVNCNDGVTAGNCEEKGRIKKK